jgi:chromate transporter
MDRSRTMAEPAVFALFGAAHFCPVWTAVVLGKSDFVTALAAFMLLTVWKASPWIVVILTATCGMLLVAT